VTASEWQVGDRVLITSSGWPGTVEEVDQEPFEDGNTLIGVRQDTPDGGPSVLTSYMMSDDVVPLPENVQPLPWSRQKRRDAALFNIRVNSLCRDLVKDDGDAG
jgi:hypothetical protein